MSGLVLVAALSLAMLVDLINHRRDMALLGLHKDGGDPVGDVHQAGSARRRGRW